VVVTVNQMAILLKQVVSESDFDKRNKLIKQVEDLEHKK